MSGSKVRRGVLFGGVGFLLAMGVLPIIYRVSQMTPGEEPPPVSQLESGILWLLIFLIGAGSFYLGYSGWGRHKDY